jgi:hypothetical protein
MKLSDLNVTQEGLKRVRSQEMVNTLYDLRVELARRGVSDG